MENKNDNTNNFNIKKKSAFGTYLKRNSAYLVLLVCLLIAAGAFALFMPKKDGYDGNKNNPAPVGKSDDESIDEALGPKPTLRPVIDARNTQIPDFTPAPKPSDNPAALLNPPVDGEVVWDFAINELIYSKTLDQWTTHTGVDIASPMGTPVRAVAAGTVEKVYQDPGLGITVALVHANGHKTYYSNLAEDNTLPKEGTKVAANQEIGKVGNTASYECAEKSHLHFEYHVNGSPVNPKKYIRIGK